MSRRTQPSSADRGPAASTTKRFRNASSALPLTLLIILTWLLPACSCSRGEEPPDPPQRIEEVPEGAVFYLSDHQNTPLVLTNTRGQIIRSVAHHPYGSTRYETGDDDPHGFVGNERDRGSGLSDFKARCYRTQSGIFLAPDPVAAFEPERLPQTPSRLASYVYAAGDPINLMDPTGETPTNAYEYIVEQQVGLQLPPAAKAAIDANRPRGWMRAAEVASMLSGVGEGVGLATRLSRSALATAGVQSALRSGGAALRRVLGRVGFQPRSTHGVSFFGADVLPHVNRAKATLGRSGTSTFFMPIEDAALVNNAADAARYTGMAPSVAKAYLRGDSVYGVAFPLRGLPVTRPTPAHAAGFSHFLQGGQTAVRGAGKNGGFLVNPTREFVTPGGRPMPAGSTLFQLGDCGERLTLRRF
jgi:RHS repeat-associated protein